MPSSSPVPRRIGPRLPVALVVLAALAAACTRTVTADAPPAAEFLLSAGDSTYWVKSGPAGSNVRGSAMLLARFGGGFHEVYVTDDDRSYPDATFLGERLYRRDLVRGDSAVVFDDPAIARLAARYATRHPDERPLAPDEEGAEEPATVATTELDVLDVHGPYLTLEHRANADGDVGGHRHTVRHVVVDLRTGREASLGALFGDAAAAAAVAGGRRALDALRDSLAALSGDVPPDAVESLRTLVFDPASFGLASEDGVPAVVFALAGRTRSGEVVAIELPPVRVPAPAWWGDVRPGLPRPTADSAADQWTREGYHVVARPGPGAESAALVLRRPAGGREWPLARVPAPVHQIFPLDRPPIDSVARRALARAFNESTLYDEQAATASLAPRPPAVPIVRVRHRAPARAHRAHQPAPLPLPRS